MAADRSYIKENDRERARLKRLVARLTDAELARPMPGGWTVAGVLEHAALWDQRVVVLFERWRTTGTEPDPEPDDVDWINDAPKPMLLAVAPRRAAELAVAIAEAADATVAALSDEMIAKNQASRGQLNLVRAQHRAEHIDQIEAALAR